MAILSSQFHITDHKSYQIVKRRPPPSSISCSMQPSQNNIKVIVNGAAKEIGRAAVVAVTKARGMEVAGAVDSKFVGEDIGNVSDSLISPSHSFTHRSKSSATYPEKCNERPRCTSLSRSLHFFGYFVCDMEEPLEIPIANDLTMVLGSISQSKEIAVVLDFTDPSTVYDNVKQATAFGMKSVVYVPWIKLDTVSALSAFCEKASMGCLIAPTLSIGSILLQQAAISASFYYKNIEIVESRQNAGDSPSSDAIQIANNLSNVGQVYNKEDISTEVLARGQVLGEDGVRVHSMVLPGLPSSTTVYFSGPGEVYSVKHDITDVQCLMPGLILAIRKVVRLKNLVYGLEKVL